METEASKRRVDRLFLCSRNRVLARSQDVLFKPEPLHEMPRASSNLLAWDFMKSVTTNDKIFVGVDVSKATLDVYRPDTKEVFKIESSDEAIALLCSQLEKMKRKVMVVMEGTGQSGEQSTQAILGR